MLRKANVVSPFIYTNVLSLTLLFFTLPKLSFSLSHFFYKLKHLQFLKDLKHFPLNPSMAATSSYAFKTDCILCVANPLVNDAKNQMLMPFETFEAQEDNLFLIIV